MFIKTIFCRYIVIALLWIFIVSCSKEATHSDKPVVLTTTALIADIVQNVGGDFVLVKSIMAPGMDPHSYKASERDVIEVASAKLIFYNGLHLEGKLSEVLDRAKNTIPSYSITEYIPQSSLIKTDEYGYDPHVWFDPLLWIFAINRVADSLVEMDPANTIYYRKNEDRYVEELLRAFQTTKEQLDSVPESKRVLVTSHNAFAYFGKAYGWEVIGIQGSSTVNEASVYTIQALARTIVNKGVSCVFTEMSVSPRSVDALIASSEALSAKMHSGQPLYSDSLGSANSGASNYVDMLNYNINMILLGILND